VRGTALDALPVAASPVKPLAMHALTIPLARMNIV